MSVEIDTLQFSLMADTNQKFGNMDSRMFKEMLKSFSFDNSEEEEDIVDIQSVEQKVIILNNRCLYCQKFECVADHEEGKYICMSCGRGNGEILDSGQEWRSLSCDDMRRQSDPSRVGMPVNEHFKKASLSTTINGYGHQNFRKFQRYNTMEYDERSLLKNFQYIDFSTEDVFPEVVKDHAKNTFKLVNENENKRGSKKHSTMAACVFFASKGRDMTPNKEKLSQQFNIKKKKFTKGCNFFREKLFEKAPEFYSKMKPVCAEDEIKRIGTLFNMPKIYKDIACYVAYMAQELGIVIKNTPISIAVGSIFLVSTIYKLDIDKRDIAEKCDISDVTINKSLSLLLSYKLILVPTKRLFDKYLEIKSQDKIDD